MIPRDYQASLMNMRQLGDGFLTENIYLPEWPETLFRT